MAKRVTALEDRMLQITRDVYRIAPDQYRKDPNDRDPLNRAWNGAVDRATESMYALADLGDLLRQKADITEPGPVARYWAEREKKSEEPVLCDGEGI